jgi:hypothetical protein
MTRKIAVCRDMPSDSGCTLTITGEEDEGLAAATAHAVNVHGRTDDDALREGIHSMLRDSPQATAEEAFVQLIEFRTDRTEEFDAAAEEWLAARCRTHRCLVHRRSRPRGPRRLRRDGGIPVL